LNELEITPQLKVSELLQAFPHLEEKVTAMTPSFRKLTNATIKKSIFGITSLSQAAKTGGLPLVDYINELRARVGQPPLDVDVDDGDASEPPVWFKTGAIVKSIDAGPMLERNEHPVALVLQEAAKLAEGEILELVTPFVPAPLIGQVEGAGCLSWTLSRSSDEFKSYFTPQNS